MDDDGSPGETRMTDGERSVAADMGHRAEEDGEGPVNLGDPGSSRSRPQEKKEDNADLGSALRAIYSRAVEEEIPPEMLDLLKRLD